MPYTTAGKNAMLDALGALITHVGLLTAGSAITSVTGTASTDKLTKSSHGLSNGDLVALSLLAHLTGVTGAESTDKLTKSSHGLSNGDLVVLWGLTGGTGLFENVPYYVVGVDGNDFQLSLISGGAAINFTTDISDVNIKKLGNELSGDVPYYVVGVDGNDFQLSLVSGGAAIDFSADISSVSVVPLSEISGGSPAYARVAIAWNSASGGSMDDSTNGAEMNVPASGVVDYVGFYSAASAGTLYAIDPVTQETFGGQGTYTVTDADLDLNA